MRVSKEEWQRLNEDEDHPLMNRVTQAQLAPGSVFKIVMATAMLQEKVPAENFTAFCPGYAMFYGRMFKCRIYGKGGHGVMNLHPPSSIPATSFSTTSASAWGLIAFRNTQRCWDWARRRGSICRQKNRGWCRRKSGCSAYYHRKWYPGRNDFSFHRTGSGHSHTLQLAYMIGGIASGGDFKQPHLLKDAPNVGRKHVQFDEDTVEQVTQGMYGVVNEGGTAGAVKFQGIEFCGKTGTAQVMAARQGTLHQGRKKV